jgi:hypothetical protein
MSRHTNFLKPICALNGRHNWNMFRITARLVESERKLLGEKWSGRSAPYNSGKLGCSDLVIIRQWPMLPFYRD